jgi:hypothetical protein
MDLLISDDKFELPCVYSGIMFYSSRPRVLAFNGRYLRSCRVIDKKVQVSISYKQYNKEIEVDLSGILGMCIQTWVKFCPFSINKSMA